jgi:Family of unknown function (DUF6455)
VDVRPNEKFAWIGQTQYCYGRRQSNCTVGTSLMDWMMQKRGVDTNAARRVDGGLALLQARAKYSYCLHEDACRRWLTIRAPRRSPDFCPNAAFFLTCLSAD